MFKKIIILKMETDIEKDSSKADTIFAQLTEKYKNASEKDKASVMAQFDEIYSLAKSLKCDNVVLYLDKFKNENGF